MILISFVLTVCLLVMRGLSQQSYFEEITSYQLSLQETTSTELLYMLCFPKCIHSPPCVVVGYKEEGPNNFTCSIFVASGFIPTPITNNVLNDSEMVYFKVIKSTGKKVLSDCSDILAAGYTESGVYNVYPDWNDWYGLQVYCDMESDGGGWTVFQRRKDGSENFNSDWNTMKNGFGNLNGEFWLGNENLHRFTNQRNYRLRVDASDWDGITLNFTHTSFAVSTETDCYRLNIGDFIGPIESVYSLKAKQDGNCFTTSDSDNDDDGAYNCATYYGGAFWYGSCHGVNLNGQYLVGGGQGFGFGIVIFDWKGFHYSIKTTEMKIRPAD